MKKGRVIGEIWATKKCAALAPFRLKVVAVQGACGLCSQVVVAIDTLDAGAGETVLLSFGSGARNVVTPGANDNRHLVCDCAVSQIVDGEEQ